MRTVTYGAAVSLDGFLAGADGSIDWLHFSADVQEFNAAYWATVDTVLIGRKTWDAAMAMARTDRDRAKAFNAGKTTYVFSRTLGSDSTPGAELVSSDAGEFVRELKEKPGRGICLLGGGELAQSLLAAGVVDEVGLNIHPVILGSGIPFFRDPGRRIPLDLIESRTIEGGCVLSTYRVRSAESPVRRAAGRARSVRRG